MVWLLLFNPTRSGFDRTFIIKVVPSREFFFSLVSSIEDSFFYFKDGMLWFQEHLAAISIMLNNCPLVLHVRLLFDYQNVYIIFYGFSC